MKLKLLDLFCGAGGMSLGFHLTKKYRVVGAIDNWKPALETYKYNFPDVPIENILLDSVDDVFEEKNTKYDNFRNKLLKEKIDIIIGGPPCQGMSLAGKRLNDDPRNQLFKSFVKAVNFCKPKAFVMENVPGLLSTNDGNLNKAILEHFKNIGYSHFESHKPTILRSEQYGVPQIRRRLFYLGFRKDIDASNLNWPPKPSHLKYIKSKNKVEGIRDLFDDIETLPYPVNVYEAISDLPKLNSGEGSITLDYDDNDDNLSSYQHMIRNWKSCPRKNEKPKVYNHEASNHTQKLIDKIKITECGMSVDDKYHDSKKWNPKAPGYTVKALGAGGGSTNRRAFHYSKSQARGSTIRENARIQSFPDWFFFKGSKTDQMSQVGNAVPPFLAKAIATSLFKKFEKDEN